MSSDVMPGAVDAASAMTGTTDLADASRRLFEQTFNEGTFDLAQQLIAPEAINHDPALRLRCVTYGAPTRLSG
jgi:hypothetical protein